MPEPRSVTDLRRLCTLARLHPRADQEAELQRRLETVIAAFASLARVPLRDLGPDGDGAYPMAGPRPDVPGPVLDPAEVLANAPRAAAGMFQVPRVVEG